ncbi:YpiF family protein [Halalkalibacter urbisdiaboli]|uniref:YpiF family protein n=1 Tax=Halalkalibacter urbisdiaboli TaxID=1960589 RepID=UPI000B43C167|nr:YpiF family protein [Halalkalibacter urbisdiaboli]
MKWQATEMDTYLKEKEYVDTALIALIPISWQEQVKSTVAMGEFIGIISSELERQFQGRVVLFPAFSYLKTEDVHSRTQRLLSWKRELELGGMQHVILLTSDGEWKTIESQLESLLIWLPTVPLEHMDQVHKREVISEQIKQLVPILTNKWQYR